MIVSWAATSPKSGRFKPFERSGFDGLVARFEELRAQGRGYLEVRGDSEFPVLTLGFTGAVAVVHHMSAQDETSLLAADVPGDADAAVLVIDELVEFAPDFLLDLDRGWGAVTEFLRTGDAAPAGEWCKL